MSNDSIIDDLKSQMAGAAFMQEVEANTESIDLTVLLAAKVSGIPSDVLIVILSGIIGRLLINECPERARQHYADLAKRVIDSAVALSTKE